LISARATIAGALPSILLGGLGFYLDGSFVAILSPRCGFRFAPPGEQIATRTVWFGAGVWSRAEVGFDGLI
jgi:hypothetical protein